MVHPVMMPAPTVSHGEFKNLAPFRRYLKAYRWRIAAATLTVVLTSALMLGLGGALKYFVDYGLAAGDGARLNQAFALLLILPLLLAVCSYLRISLSAWIGEHVVRDIRRDAYARLLSMHLGYFETSRTGDILSRLMTDVTLMQVVISSSIPMAARSLLVLTGGCVMLTIISPQLVGYVLLMVPLVVMPLFYLSRRLRTLAREVQGKVAEVSAQAEETFSLIRTVQAMTLEPRQIHAFDDHSQELLAMSMGRIRLRSFLMALVICLVFSAVAVVLWMGGYAVLHGQMTHGALSAFVFYAVMVATSFGSLSDLYTDMQRAAGAAERVGEVLQLTPQIVSPANTKAQSVEKLRSADIRFEGVDFTYPSRPEHPALKDINLHIRAGEVVALVGSSGAGKSTLFQLLLRFYDPAGGRILLNGEDIRTLPLADLRGHIGLVPQEPVIFSADAMENIRAGRVEATDEEVMNAARAASALEFLEKLPKGMHTFLGEKGVRLSGGQRQRVAIARAIIRDPAILLLDEATSALDAENERLVQQALGKLMKGRTTLVIAHRLSTVVGADRIVLLNNGRIEAMGTHAELLAKSELYAQFARLQFDYAASA